MTHVLIVDDLEESRYLLQMLLEGNGYKVTAVRDGLEALTAGKHEPPNVIVSDALMPNMDGFVLCHEWMQDARLRVIPFIFYSATYATPESEKLARELGAARYLIKPQEPDAFLAELTMVLREWSGRPEPVTATLEESAFNLIHKRVLAEKLEDKLAQLENTNLQLRASEARYRTLFECAPDGIVIFRGDTASRLIDVNTSLCQMLGYTRDELIALRPPDIVTEAEIEHVVPAINLIQTRSPYYREWQFRRKDGSGITAEVIATTLPDGNLLALIRDITARMHREEELRRLNRTLTLIRECHQVLVYATDETSLLAGVCRRIAESSGYLFVWAGFAEQDAARRVRPVAWSGIEDETLLATTRNITWDDTATGQGPTGTAVRTGQTMVARDLQTDPRYLPWRDVGVRLGINSAISLPFKASGKVLGAISIYAREPGAFDDQEMSLLSELADDLAYGLDALREGAERRRAEEQLLLSRHAIESSNDGILITDSSLSDRPISYVNAAFERITGYTAAEAVGRNARFLLGEETDQIGVDELRAALREQRAAKVVLRNFRKDGTAFWNELSLAPVLTESGQTRHFVSIINDITERKSYETQLEYQANYDELTGLANRNLLADRMAQAITYAHRADRLVAVILLDLDRFKMVNDSLGHGTGDALLKVVAERLSTCGRPGDTVARLGGDEFVMVMADVADENDVAPLVRNVLDLLAHDITVAGHDMVATASVGIALYPRDGEEAGTLLKNADAAMYHAKELGRNSFQFYTPELNTRTLQRLELETALRRALERNELMLFYQPKLELRRGQMIGAEALIRWRHPVLGMVSPADFIPLAEETGLIVPIGEWVIETACAQLKAWQNAGLPDISVAVNLSARQFEQKDLPRVVSEALRLNEIEAHCLELEVTESAVMQDPERTVVTLREFKQIGVSLSLDDFGTGYSSLNYLKRFPIDTLKIDQSFVRDITTNPDDAAIAVAVISLAHSLKRRVVAEGVETEAQLNYLRRHGCDEMQGYYFSRPLPAEEFAALLREGRSLSLGAATAEEAVRTLLLVDDEPIVIEALRRQLQDEGYRLLTAASAAEGLELLALNEVQVIISDQGMAEMSGTELLGRVREMYPDTIRIMLTGDNDPDLARDAINRAGIHKLLTKPWEGDLLRDHIREAFVHYEAQKGSQ